MDSLTNKLAHSKESKDHPSRSQLIEDYMPFIIKEISSVTGRYVSYHHSLELSVGLLAFDEAIDKYEGVKGSFANFASLVIRSRIKDYLKKDDYYHHHIPIEEVEEYGDSFELERFDLKEEVAQFNTSLKNFKIDIEALVDESPSHEKTRKENILLGKNISKEEPIVSKLYKTKKLPMADIILRFSTSKKKLKYHRNFLISVIVVFVEDLTGIMDFMNLGGIPHD